MKKEMLINVLQPEESRIAIVEDGVLEELYVERNSLENYVGNIYKGRVVNIEPSIQAAFVDFGVGRNGFLHVSDVEFQYYRHLLDKSDGLEDADDDTDDLDPSDVADGRGGSSGSRGRFNERSARNKPPIQEIFQRG
ncbi:MAG: S1 RNA-binding domain-containing protein, partial [Planctomycetes bacterium]|nr:S1 RNA-binding domain-containing protein [Planctomycetota bacterium]